MADTITIKDGANADKVIATDEVTRNAVLEHQQVMKLALGVDGAHDLLVDSGQQIKANSVPVAIASDQDTLAVSLASVPSHAVTNAGTFAVQDSEKLVDDAAFGPASSHVQPVGFTADDASTDLVDEGDIGAARMTLDRRQIVQLGESGANQVKGGGSQTGTSDQAVMAAGGAGVYNYLACVTLYNSSATNTYANIKDGSTVVAVVPLPAYGGAIFQPAHALRGTANTAWNVAAGAGVTTAYFYGFGYKASA